jgi:endonuclease YncB( thermonuclease family)
MVAAAAVLTVGFFSLTDTERPEPASEAKPVPPITADVAQPSAAPTSKVQDRPGAIEAASLPQSLELEPPYLIIDGLTFAAGRITIRLSGVEGPPATAACKDEGGLLWACGLQARAALNNEIRKQNLSCTPVTALGSVIEATCRVEGSDLAQRLLSAGWARPLGNQAGRDAADEAQRVKRGLWNGNWSLVERGTNPNAPSGLRQSLDSVSP